MNRSPSHLLAVICAAFLTAFLAPFARANWKPDGASICSAPYSQLAPAAIPVGADQAIIAWRDHRNNSTWSIFAQRVNVAGQTQWTNGGVVLCTDTDIGDPVIAPGSSGSAIVAWTDTRWGSLTYVVCAQSVSAFGVPQWTTNGVVVSDTTGQADDLMIVSDGAGGVIIAWLNASNDVYAQRLNAAGFPQWTIGGELLASPGASNPDMVSSSTGAIITWAQPSTVDAYHDIFIQRVDGAGSPQWGSGGVGVCTATGEQYVPVIATDGAAGAIVAWHDARGSSYDVYAQRVDLSGTATWATDGVLLCGAVENQAGAAIVSDDMGGAIVTWYDYRNGDYDIYAQRVNNSGAPLWMNDGVAVCTATGSQLRPLITSDGSSGALLTWEDDRGADKDIYVQHIDASGGPQWIGDGAAVCTAEKGQVEQQIVSDGAGGAIVAWSDYRKTTESDIYAGKIDSAGVLTAIHDGRPVRLPTALRNYPNPFSTNTTIEFDAPGNGAVRIDVFDASGRKVRELTLDGLDAGLQHIAFDGRDGSGHPLASGVYFYHVRNDVAAPAGKLVIVR